MSDLDDLHAILDQLVDGQQVTATRIDGAFVHTLTGPVEVWHNGIELDRETIRGYGDIPDRLTAFETVLTETVTVTRDDGEGALLEAIQGLGVGQTATADFRDEEGTAVAVTGRLAGAAARRIDGLWLDAYLTERDGAHHPHHLLHALTYDREVTKRWERGER